MTGTDTYKLNPVHFGHGSTPDSTSWYPARTPLTSRQLGGATRGCSYRARTHAHVLGLVIGMVGLWSLSTAVIARTIASRRATAWCSECESSIFLFDVPVTGQLEVDRTKALRRAEHAAVVAPSTGTHPTCLAPRRRPAKVTSTLRRKATICFPRWVSAGAHSVVRYLWDTSGSFLSIAWAWPMIISGRKDLILNILSNW